MYAFALIDVPHGFEFLQLGWWALHVVAITLVFLIGYSVGARKSR